MATEKPKTSVAPHRRRRRWLWLLPAALLVLLIWFWKPLNGYAQAGASYGARVGCACRHVAGRSLSDCRKDFEEGMGLIMLSEDAAAKSVTARFPLLASQTATFRDGPGCVLEPWDD
jgi:hypothetical protein